MHKSSRSDGTVNFRVLNGQEPTLLFVHGFGCALEDWNAQLQGLSEFKRVALDLPGHGASTLPGAVTMASMAAAVNVAKTESGARNVILVGHSLGAKIIREAYAQSRDDICGLVLIDSAFYDGERSTLVERARKLIDAAGFGAYAARHFAAMFRPTADPEVKAAIIARALRMDPDFGRALYLEAVGWDPVRGKETLRNLAVPALALQATNLDAEFKRQPLQPGSRTPFIDMVETLVPLCETRIIENSGHFPMFDAPSAINREIRAFASRVIRT